MITVEVRQSVQLGEIQARRVVKEWIEKWLDHAPSDKRTGVDNVSSSARGLRDALEAFERANSGDNGK